MPGNKKFSGLLTDPKPLPPDDDTPAAQDTQAAQAPPAEPRKPAKPRQQRPAAEPSPAEATPSAVASMPPASRTIRLHASAAEPLNAAWLNERQQTNPKLSYPEFATMIVRLGLTAYEKRRARSA